MTYKTERAITVRDITISVRTSDRTTLDLDVSTTEQVIVRGTRHTTDAQATDLVQRRRRCIYQQLARIAATTPINPVKLLDTGEVFAVPGRPHRLRIVPDAEQPEPITRHLHPEPGAWLHMRHTTAANLDQPCRTIINFYTKTAQDWLKNIAPQVATFIAKSDIPLTASTRLRTTRAHYHPTRGLTLHWATAQLDERTLLELIHSAAKLHTVADNHGLDHDLRNLWLDHLVTPTKLPQDDPQPAPDSTCPDHSAPPYYPPPSTPTVATSHAAPPPACNEATAPTTTKPASLPEPASTPAKPNASSTASTTAPDLTATNPATPTTPAPCTTTTASTANATGTPLHSA